MSGIAYLTLSIIIAVLIVMTLGIRCSQSHYDLAFLFEIIAEILLIVIFIPTSFVFDSLYFWTKLSLFLAMVAFLVTRLIHRKK